MLNDIIVGIARALGAAFGEGFRVYENDVAQGFTEPCFFIAALEPEQTPLLGERAVRRYPFDIHYFPGADGTNAAIYDMAECLLCVMRYIILPDGDKLRGLSMRYRVEDGVLHFFVTYNRIVNIPKEQPVMEILDTDVKTKKG